MPVKVKKQDYNEFLNIEKACELNNYLQKTGCSSLSLSISHPYFYDYPCSANEYYRKFISYFSDMIAKNIYYPQKELCWNTISVAEVSDNPYGLINHFSRMGCKAYRIGKFGSETELFDSVLHTQNIIGLSGSETKYPNIDYLLLETDDIHIVKNITEKIKPKYCIVTCDIEDVINIEEYKLVDIAFKTYKSQNMVSVMVFKEDR